MENIKIGILACSGEEFLGGTITRMAARKVLERMRFGRSVTICLPLFVAGGEEERSFASNYPVIAVDGCSQSCAMKACEKYSGNVAAHIDLCEILGEDVALHSVISARDLTDDHEKMVNKVAEAICVEFDKIVETNS